MHQKVLIELSNLSNIKYERKKSVVKTTNKEITTDKVVDLPTPLAPPLVESPNIQLIIDIIKPKIIVFNKDLTISTIDNTIAEDLKNTAGLIEYKVKQIKELLAKLVKNEKKVNTGNIKEHEIIRGITKYTNGLVFNKYNASICSVTFIVASSEVKYDPTRPIRIIEVNMGDNSLIKAIVRTDPIRLTALRYKNSFATCKVKTKLIKQAVIKLISNEPGPTIFTCSIIL